MQKLLAVALFTSLALIFPSKGHAQGWTHQYDRTQTLTITLGNAFPYTITIQTVGGGTKTHTVTGTNKTDTYIIRPGTTTITATYDAGGGNFKPAAYADCPGPSVKFSFVSHNLDCKAYTDAWVLIQPGS